MSKWISFAESYPVDSKACFGALHVINEELAQKSVLVGDGLKPSEADVIVFSLLHPFVVCILYLLLPIIFHIDHSCVLFILKIEIFMFLALYWDLFNTTTSGGPTDILLFFSSLRFYKGLL